MQGEPKVLPVDPTQEAIIRMWRELGDSHMNEHKEIIDRFYEWEEGTKTIEIFEWFDKKFTRETRIYLIEEGRP